MVVFTADLIRVSSAEDIATAPNALKENPERSRVSPVVSCLHPSDTMPKRFVYILRSLTVRDRRYVGVTADVRARLTAHNAGLSPFTAKYRPWVVTTRIEFEDEHRAAAFERYLKSPSGRAFAAALRRGRGM